MVNLTFEFDEASLRHEQETREIILLWHLAVLSEEIIENRKKRRRKIRQFQLQAEAGIKKRKAKAPTPPP